MTKPVILTGIRSNEEPTIANYLGAMLPMVEMQKQYAGEYQINMFVPDLHSITTPIEYDKLYRNTLNNLKYFMAAGLDINNPDTYVYRQSYIPAHSELTWILDCFAGFGELSRMIQFKEKAGLIELKETLKTIEEHAAEMESRFENKFDKDEVIDSVEFIIKEIESYNHKTGDEVSIGLLNYPVLMAADILLYNAKYVPVGEDQFQHLEITRDIAIRMNNKFGEIFTVPEATKAQTQFIKRDSGLRIRNLVDPTKKMSKSDENNNSKILLIDEPEAAAKKIMSATTDSIGSIHFDWEKQPGITNLLQILALLTNRSQSEVNADWEGRTSYGEFKKAVSEAVKAFLGDFQGKLGQISDETLVSKLEQSERDLTPVANATLLRAQQAVGLRPKG